MFTEFELAFPPGLTVVVFPGIGVVVVPGCCVVVELVDASGILAELQPFPVHSIHVFVLAHICVLFEEHARVNTPAVVSME